MESQALPPPKFSPPTLAIRDRAIDPAVIARARNWATVVDYDEAPDTPRLAGLFLRCIRCSQGVARLAYLAGTGPDAVRPLPATVVDLEAAVLLHVLQAHRRDVDPEWSGT